MLGINSGSRAVSISSRLRTDANDSNDKFVSPPVKSNKDSGGESFGNTGSGNQSGNTDSFAKYQSPRVLKADSVIGKVTLAGTEVPDLISTFESTAKSDPAQIRAALEC